MILRAPGYNLSRRREAAGTVTERGREGSASGARPGPASFCLSRLCEGLDPLSVSGNLVRPVADLCTDSRRVSPGALFFALPGERTDGSFYIQDAIDRGAAVIITEKANRSHPRATIVQVRDARAAMGVVSRRFFKFPESQLDLIGVTGSYGKSVVAHLLKHLLEFDQPVGLFSSIQYDLGSRTVPSYRTTPEPVDLYGMLAQVEASGCRRAVVEISTRGIEQKRVNGLPLDVAIFLNLGRENAGPEGAGKTSFLTKCEIFSGAQGLLPRAAAVNLDDAYGRRLIQAIPGSVRLVTFGRSPHAEVRATDIAESSSGASMRIIWPEGSAKVRTRQLGSFNVSNILAAVAGAYACGLDLNLILPRLLSFSGAPGRMEPVEEGQPFKLIVDCARTPEAVRHVLREAREMGEGRLLAVFGCCGERDRSRRPLLVEAVQEEADFSWATADNPRNEPLGNIFRDMRHGVTDPGGIVFVDNRRSAIALALDTALPGDVVVLLGKGNDSFQYAGYAALPFDDRLVARELLALREVALLNL